MKWNERRQEILIDRIGEVFRECALLWLVFSMLDRLIEEKLTLPWVTWNLCGSIALWIVGMYVELKEKRHDSE